ncbi:hypothetical protein FRC06_008331 [Ceratobasidium sp. 370]|nr:hypothetical protein FRC06_008331 [Ceratobasidium sp. 370]
MHQRWPNASSLSSLGFPPLGAVHPAPAPHPNASPATGLLISLTPLPDPRTAEELARWAQCLIKLGEQVASSALPRPGLTAAAGADAGATPAPAPASASTTPDKASTSPQHRPTSSNGRRTPSESEFEFDALRPSRASASALAGMGAFPPAALASDKRSFVPPKSAPPASIASNSEEDAKGKAKVEEPYRRDPGDAGGRQPGVAGKARQGRGLDWREEGRYEDAGC